MVAGAGYSLIVKKNYDFLESRLNFSDLNAIFLEDVFITVFQTVMKKIIRRKAWFCFAVHLRKAASGLTQTPLRGGLRLAGSFTPLVAALRIKNPA